MPKPLLLLLAAWIGLVVLLVLTLGLAFVPLGTGLELVRTLAPLRPQAAFLVISGRIGRKEVLGSGLEVGERLKYLKKPFLLSELQAVVTEFERHWPAGTN